MHEALYYNALALALGGDYGKLSRRRQKFGNWERAYRATIGPKTVNNGSGAPEPHAAKEWAALEKSGVRLIMRGETSYPPLLEEIEESPFGLYILGTMPVGPYFSAVGTRRATPEGKAIAQHFAGTLARSGFVIASGLAFGIDAASHEGCLDADGNTVAVLAGGLHEVYPHENTRLAERILAGGGALISEYPLGSPPFGPRFLERNRIIAGLSRGVLIIEAPEKSGALVTARLAMGANRDVFVVPGSVTNSRLKGSHWLIRQGAELVTSPEEILESYGVTIEAQRAGAESAASPEEKQVLAALRGERAPADVDKISIAAKLEPRIVNRTLAFLVMKNLVKEEGGGYTI